jgi:superfamily I DNA/RNA helicase
MMSATQELLERQMMRDMEAHNSAAARAMQKQKHILCKVDALERRCEMGSFHSVADRVMQEQNRRMNHPMYQRMFRAAEDAATRKKERGLWYYRRTTGIINLDSILKAVHRELERLFPTKLDPESFAKRIRATLSAQNNCDGIVKVHSPPVRLIPKTLHPIDPVA